MNKVIKPKNTKTSYAHQTRPIMLDRSKRPATAPPAEQIEQLLNELIEPAIFNLVRHYQDLGLRSRSLTLPVMSCFLLSLIWRQTGSVSEAVRELNQHGLLWQPPLKISQQAVSQRLRELPANLFEMALGQILPQMQQRWQVRTRPLPTGLPAALSQFTEVVAVDASSLDALIKKVGLLRETEATVLAGRMVALLDVASQLPRQVWYGEDSKAHEQNWWDQICQTVKEGSLLLFDLGFVNYARYEQLGRENKSFVSRAKTNMLYRPVQELGGGSGWREWLVEVTSREVKSLKLRLVEVEYGGKPYRYVTNVLEPERLRAEEIGALYRQRWRIEDAFKTVKRLLGLAYFYGSSINAIMLQIWTSWILYSVLIDLSDEVAEELKQPLRGISVEMVYRGLYHYSRARERGSGLGVVEYLVNNAKLLGIVKRSKKKVLKS